MGKYQRTSSVEIVKLHRDLTVVTKWKSAPFGGQSPKELTTFKTGTYLIFDEDEDELLNMTAEEFASQKRYILDEIEHVTAGGKGNNRQQQQGKGRGDNRGYERDDPREERRRQDVAPITIEPDWALPAQIPSWAMPDVPQQGKAKTTLTEV